MIKLSKKAIGIISGVSAGVLATGTVTAGLVIKKDSKTPSRVLDPLKRGSNYYPYPIVNYIKTNSKIQDLVRLEKIDNSFIYVIDEQRFKTNIKSIVTEALQKIKIFSSKWNSYKVEVTYKIDKTQKISIDIVWYLPDAKIKYYDQFDLILEVI